MSRVASRNRVLQWSTDAGPVILTWPEAMSPEDAEDAVAVVNLALRNIVRLAACRLPFEAYDAAMKEAFNDHP